ncbi:hypothetical protein [Photorhabdus luminescens]|nr:hypothetical protein [Photorhabdus luminescens]
MQATLAFWQGLTYNTENVPSGKVQGCPATGCCCIVMTINRQGSYSPLLW